MREEQAMKSNWGLEVEAIDESVRPEDDLYQHVNGRWIKGAVIPENEAHWGSIGILRLATDERQRAILEDLKGKRHKAGSREQMVSDFYHTAIDMKARDALGASPLDAERAAIHALASKADALPLMAELERVGTSVLWGVSVEEDFKDSSKNALFIEHAGLGMPDREYYIDDDAESVRVRTAYLAYIKQVAGLANLDPERTATLVMNIETRLARATLDKVSRRDPYQIYNPTQVSELPIAPGIDWHQYLKIVGVPGVEKVIVSQPSYLKEAAAVFNDLSLDDLKLFLEWRLIADSASLLSQPFVDANFAFFGQTLGGQKAMRPLWRRGIGTLNATLGELFGQLYVERYFPPEAKKKIDALVGEIVAAAATRIKALDWMSPETKAKAIEKLEKMDRKIAYPSVWKTYEGLEIHPGDHYGNVSRIAAYEHQRAMSKIGKPVDRTEWHMPPQTINAYYNPVRNEMVFPAGYLQWPYFDPTADDALNYAGIGATIAHELTHGFDDQGAKFDAAGNLTDWWSDEDRAQFKERGIGLAAQFDRYTVAGGIHVNGKLTLGENIADMGGLAIAYDAYQRHLAKSGRKTVGGLTPEERFFYAYAQADREVLRPELEKTLALNDPHAPSRFRINGPLSNFKPFYDTFKLKESSGLYRDPKDRVTIW